VEGRLQAINVGHDLLVQFDECGAGSAEASIVLGPAAKVGEFARRQGAEAGLAVFGPGNHAGGMEGAFVRGTVTGRFAASGVEVVDGTFDKLPEGEHGVDLTAVVVEQ
jgi:hypothetical protein